MEVNMDIKEEITINLKPKDIEELVNNALLEKGYKITNINFKVEEKCEGYPEVYYKVFTGASCKAERV
jgi:hypothetical protein